jgi:hypothetical protein
LVSSRTRRTTNRNTRTWCRTYSTCIASRSPFAIRPISTSSDVDCIGSDGRTREVSRKRLPLGSRFCHRDGGWCPLSVVAPPEIAVDLDGMAVAVAAARTAPQRERSGRPVRLHPGAGCLSKAKPIPIAPGRGGSATLRASMSPTAAVPARCRRRSYRCAAGRPPWRSSARRWSPSCRPADRSILIARLLDELVGDGKQRWRHVEAERLGGLQVYHKLVLGRCLHRKIAWSFSPQNAIDV